MLDHVTVKVSDIGRSKTFYAAALAPLGYAILVDATPAAAGRYVGFGVGAKADFWIGAGSALSPGVHVAFAASSRAAVDAFYAAGLASGGADNGPPGLRPQYHANYYGAFVRDPDGNNVEAVCHREGGT